MAHSEVRGAAGRNVRPVDAFGWKGVCGRVMKQVVGEFLQKTGEGPKP